MSLSQWAGEAAPSSFSLAARAVATGHVAAILPALAAADLPPAVATQVPIRFRKSFDREIGPASNPRLLLVRPVLHHATSLLAQTRRC